MTTATPSGRASRPSAHFITLGCPKNEVDTEKMRATLSGAGFELATDLNEADVAILNTCGFIQDAVEESIAEILDLIDWRDAQEGRRLVVAGCLVSRFADDLATELGEVDGFLPVADEASIASLLGSLTSTLIEQPDGQPTRLDSGPSAYLQISDGCHRACAYCTIPSIRGPYRSRPLADIVAEAELLASLGAREVVLIGQDISAYGRDSADPHALPDVIRAVAAVTDIHWIRLMYVQPDGVTPELLETMAGEPKVCDYLDIPLQHASASVLRSMRRTGSAKEFLGLLSRIREALPDVAVRTTVIAGFPGETEEDIGELIDFVTEADFDYVGVFPYSPEEGTEAATMEGMLSPEVRLARAQMVRDAADAVGEARSAGHVGKTLEVLAEGLDVDGAPVGRWRGQAPDVDGIVSLDHTVIAGTFVHVRITDALGYDLEGSVLS